MMMMMRLISNDNWLLFVVVACRDKKEVQGLDLVNPPEGAKVGETVFFEDDTAEPDRPSISNARFKKLLKVLSPSSSHRLC